MAIGLGLIGAGRIGQVHARNAAGDAVSDCGLVAVADPVADAAAAVAASTGARAHTGPEELIADPAVDAVLVCSPTDTHLALVEACAAAGKPVFCEKPLAVGLARIDAVLARVDAAGVPLMVGFQRRFDPGFQGCN